MGERGLQIAEELAEGKKRNSKMERLRKLWKLIAEKGLDALLISPPENLRYLAGFTGSSGWLLISGQSAILVTDFRYVEQAKGESPGFEIIQVKQELHDWLPRLICDLGWRKLGFESNFVSYESHHKVSEAIKAKQINLELVPTAGIVEQLRSVKEPEELILITKAVELADAALEQAKAIIRPGVTEKEVAWEIEKDLRQKGSEGVPFEIIVASGPNSALPHARPTDKTICSGEPVVIDMGARINGYCSDLSRTLFLGGANKTFQEIYNIVLKAQATAIEGTKSKMLASQADQLARTVIQQAGYGDAFGHGLGHGVGLAVHESPRLGLSSSDSLVDGMVFTIEPGIYLAGQGGVRIEDMVVLENGKARVLTKATK
ncbi:MAG: Xaa-Pro peptidase family protein [Dehalococcoidia bacterium]|nr:Xaa-Pro peptidase family protein [Dehalococcoidia bacterium]